MLRMKNVLISSLIMLCTISCARDQDLNLKIIVAGRVVDAKGSPIAGAWVRASLGLDLDGPVVFTGDDGTFVAQATSDYWFKGRASIEVRAAGYEDSWTYFDRWDSGQRRFEKTIILHKELRDSAHKSSGLVIGLNSADAYPLRDVLVSVRCDGMAYGIGDITDTQGLVRFDGLPEGNCEAHTRILDGPQVEKIFTLVSGTTLRVELIWPLNLEEFERRPRHQ